MQLQKKEELDPGQKAASDAIYDRVYEDVTTGMQSGVPGEQIAEHFGLTKAKSASADEQGAALGLINSLIGGGQAQAQPQQQAQPVSMVQPQQQQQAPQADPALASIISLIEKLSTQGNQQAGGQVLPATSMFSGGGVDANNNVTQPGMARQILGGLIPMFAPGANVTENLEKAKLMQEIQGRNPLQAGEATKSALASATEIYKETLKMQNEGNLKPNDLFTKFEQASAPFITVRDSYSRMNSLQGDASPAGDLGYIFSYMKMLDPQSTIRESEQASATNASAIPDRIRNMYNNVLSGQKLTPDQRKDFQSKAKGLFKSAEAQQKKTTDQFSNLAKRNKIDPEKIIRDTGMSENSSSDSSGRIDLGGGFSMRKI